MFKKENIKKVRAQNMQCSGLVKDIRFNFDFDDYIKDDLAKQIGLEMMRNNLIEFTTTEEGGIIRTTAEALVYDKNEKSEE